jgi:O-antigen ligase
LIAGIGIFFLLGHQKMVMAASIVILSGFILVSPLAGSVTGIVEDRIVKKTLTPDHALQERYNRWEVAWTTATTYPFSGSGWGGFLPIVAEGTVGEKSLPIPPRWHNSFMEVLSQLGFPGLLAFFWLWLKIMRREARTLMSVRDWEKHPAYLGLFVAVLTCLVYGLGEQQFFRIETASYSYFLAGLLITKGRMIRQMEENEE